MPCSGASIHSPCQFEWYKNDVKDKSIHVPGGLQCIQTLDGYIMDSPVCPSIQWDNLPHVILTSELEWDPSVLDHDYKEDEQWGEVPELDSSFDEVGDYKHRVIVQHLAYFHRQDGASLMMLLTNVFWINKPHKSLMSQFSMMHMRQNLLSQKVSHLDPPLLDQRRFPNMNLITTNYVHSLVGLVQNSSKRLLSTPKGL
jgi:hypothetical protein